MSSHRQSVARRRSFRICAIAAGLLASGVSLAEAHLDPQLVSKLAAAPATQELQVVISYKQSVPVTAAGSFASLPLPFLSSLPLPPPQAVMPRTLAAAIATPDMPRRIPDSLMREVPVRPGQAGCRPLSSLLGRSGWGGT